MAGIPTLRRPSHEDLECKATLGYNRRTPPVNQGWGRKHRGEQHKALGSIHRAKRTPSSSLHSSYHIHKDRGSWETRTRTGRVGPGKERNSLVFWRGGQINTRMMRTFQACSGKKKKNPSPFLSPTEGSSIFLTLTDISP